MDLLSKSTRFSMLGRVSPSKSGVAKVREVSALPQIGPPVVDGSGGLLVPFKAVAIVFSEATLFSKAFNCDPWLAEYLFFTRSGILSFK